MNFRCQDNIMKLKVRKHKLEGSNKVLKVLLALLLRIKIVRECENDNLITCFKISKRYK